MSDYLPKPLSVRQTQHLIKFLTVMRDLNLMSEGSFQDTAVYFDDIVWEVEQLSWEHPPLHWWETNG